MLFPSSSEADPAIRAPSSLSSHSFGRTLTLLRGGGGGGGRGWRRRRRRRRRPIRRKRICQIKNNASASLPHFQIQRRRCVLWGEGYVDRDNFVKLVSSIGDPPPPMVEGKGGGGNVSGRRPLSGPFPLLPPPPPPSNASHLFPQMPPSFRFPSSIWRRFPSHFPLSLFPPLSRSGKILKRGGGDHSSHCRNSREGGEISQIVLARL